MQFLKSNAFLCCHKGFWHSCIPRQTQTHTHTHIHRVAHFNDPWVASERTQNDGLPFGRPMDVHNSFAWPTHGIRPKRKGNGLGHAYAICTYILGNSSFLEVYKCPCNVMTKIQLPHYKPNINSLKRSATKLSISEEKHWGTFKLEFVTRVKLY